MSASSAFDNGASTPHAVANRVILKVNSKTLSDTYSSYTSYERCDTTSLSEATLVSSRTTAGTHAPAVDIDIPAVLVATDAGYDLWVDTPMRRRAYRHLLKALDAAGIGGEPAPARRGLDRRSRLAAYGAARTSVVNDTEWRETLRSLGPESALQSFDAILAAARIISPENGTKSGPPMDNPWCVSLHRDAALVPSTHNQHLFIDTEMAWKTYYRVLCAMRRARIVEKGYVEASKARRETHLRLPWVSKDTAIGA